VIGGVRASSENFDHCTESGCWMDRKPTCTKTEGQAGRPLQGGSGGQMMVANAPAAGWGKGGSSRRRNPMPRHVGKKAAKQTDGQGRGGSKKEAREMKENYS